MTKLLLRPTEAAEALGLSRATIYELLQSGAIPFVRVGRARRIPLSALEKWVADEAKCDTPTVAAAGE